MLTSRFGFGYGMGYAAYSEAIALVDSGHLVTVVHCNNNLELQQYHDSRIEFFHLPIKKIPLIGFFLFSLKLKRFLKEKINLNEFDVIYIQSLEFGLMDLAKIRPPIFYFARSTMLAQYRVLHDEEGRISLLEKAVRQTLVTLERRCMRFSTAVFVKSLIMVKEVCSLYGIDSNKVSVINGGINLKHFRMQKESSCTEFKRKFGIPLNKFIVLYAGRIVPQKGLIFLVQASLRLLQKFDLVVVIAGQILSQQYFAKVQQLLEDSVYKKCFFFLGHIDQLTMPVVFSSADCLVTPSLYEPFGMVNLQASFLGKNVITTDVTGSIRLLSSYGKISIVKAGSSAAIESALEQVLLQKPSADSHSLDLNIYSWRDVAAQLTHHFSLALRKNGS